MMLHFAPTEPHAEYPMAKETREYMKRARERLGLTQEELADHLGVGRHTIIRFERGGPVPATTILAIRHMLADKRRKLAP
jgi:DNA-binding XRE family transcriptional regulator